MIERVQRLTGWSLIVGTVLATVGYLAAFSATTHFTGAGWQGLYSVALAGDVLIALGLPAIVLGHGERMPRLTLVGYVGIFATLAMLNIAEGTFEGYVKPYLATHGGIPADAPGGFNGFEIVALLFLVVGLICLGIAVIRAHVFGWWVGALFIASPVLAFAGLPGGYALISDYLAFAALFAIGVRTLRPGLAVHDAVPARSGDLAPAV